MSPRRGDAGLTLVELLIALALLSFVLLGIVPLFLASVKSNYSGNEYTSIHILARDRLEQLMNLPLMDAQLTPGIHANDQPPRLPDPQNPSALSNVVNPFQISYQVFQYRIPNPDIAAGIVASGAPFTPTRIVAAGQVFHYKRIEVTVAAHQGGGFPTTFTPFGIGARVARVSGSVSNPAPNAILSQVDGGP
jgi:prepilin-type N-terminal cleavage/methylation domain-containing protein